MPVIVGERFKSEAIVPMERPGRARRDATGGPRQDGPQRLHGFSVDRRAGRRAHVTMLHIDRATITAPVDADMIVQKIATAYRRMRHDVSGELARTGQDALPVD
jgi:hypothetical protein